MIPAQVAPGTGCRTARTEVLRRWRRTRRLNPYQSDSDTGLLKVLALVAGIILVVLSGALDCRFAFFPLGFC